MRIDRHRRHAILAAPLGGLAASCQEPEIERLIRGYLNPGTMSQKINVNLDAFLPREDFNADGPNPPAFPQKTEFSLEDLEANAHLLKKPDFQRTTAFWDAEKIAEFVECFVKDEVIPGIILWNSTKTGNLLVVDGAHRISALLAWMEDDYGDNDKSKKFLGYQENEDQTEAAKDTRQRIFEMKLVYKSIMDDAVKTGATKAQKDLKARAKAKTLQVQWIKGDGEKAMNSFFRINLKPAALDAVELKLIKGRKTPECIATRAVVQCGAGHAYWKDFGKDRRLRTVELAKEIHALLFNPPLPKYPNGRDLPIGGKAYAGSSMSLVLNLIAETKPKGKGHPSTRTVEMLESMLSNIKQVVGDDNGCLGFHPAIYFYSHKGVFQPATLVAIVRWLQQLEKPQILKFTAIRKYFEKFLLHISHLVSTAVHAKGSGNRSVASLVSFYDFVFKELQSGKRDHEIISALKSDKKLKVYVADIVEEPEFARDFSNEVKSWGYLSDAIEYSPPCRICGAKYNYGSANGDHKRKREHGGRGTPRNFQSTHYYCNSSKDAIAPLIIAARLARGEPI